jgi:hypothetical protein
MMGLLYVNEYNVNCSELGCHAFVMTMLRFHSSKTFPAQLNTYHLLKKGPVRWNGW